MSGHNKWSKIKHKKAATDQKKSKVFSVHSRLIALESKKSGGDVNSANLKAAIERARSVNMPKENIERAVKKGVRGEGESLEGVVYEAYGPGGSALIIQGITDNKNRTSAEIKHILGRHDSSLAAPGSALWAFNKTAEGFLPQTTVELSEKDMETYARLHEEIMEHEDVTSLSSNAKV